MTPATSGTGDAQPYKRKLIEVAIPLKELSAASKAYKDRKTGSIRNLHKWFAPMPAPAWRVLLAAALLDDPVDPAEREQLVGLLKRLVPADGGPPKASALRSVRSLLGSERELPVVLDPFAGGGSTLVEAQRLGFRVVGSDLNPVPALISKFLAEIAPKTAGKRAIHESGALLDEATAFSGLKSDIIHYAEIVRNECGERLHHSTPRPAFL